MEEWKEYKLEELGTIVGGATPSTKEPYNYDGSISWITPKDLSNHCGRYISHGERMITPEGYNSCSCKMLPKGSVLFSSRAPIGYVAIAANELCTNQGFKSIIPDERLVDVTFLYYLLINNKAMIEGLGSGTTFKEVSGNVMKNVVVKIPNLEIQRRIANILSSLDDKIEMNRRINDNLEQQAQALFKSWFVDFEPFKKGEFVESELGMIPYGWRVGTLNELGDIVGGSTPSKAKPEYYTNEGIAWLTPKDLSISQRKFTSKGEIDITQEGYESCSTKLMPKGSVLFSSRAPIGYITIAKNDICTNQGFKSVIPKLAGTAFLYCFLKESTQEIENKATGSTFKEASGALMKSLPAIIPEKTVLDDFENLLSPLFHQQEVVEEENFHLSSLRDSLLPRLMSGELKISEINM